MKHYNTPELYIEDLTSARVLNELALNGVSGELDTEVGVGGEEE